MANAIACGVSELKTMAIVLPAYAKPPSRPNQKEELMVNRFPLYLPNKRQGLLALPFPLTEAELGMLEGQINNALWVAKQTFVDSAPEPAATWKPEDGWEAGEDAVRAINKHAEGGEREGE